MRRVLYLAWLIVLLAAPARAQIQIGTIKGIVTDQTGAVLPGAVLTLDNSIAGSRRPATTNERGEFAFNNVPPATYSLRVEAPGFQFQARSVQVRSNLPLTVEFRLSVSGQTGSATVVAREALVPGDEAQTQVELDENFLQRRSHSSRGGQWQALIATTPGWTTQNNGLLHVRGVDDGILYVVDGVPTTDRVDAISASAFEAEMVSSLRVLTGNIPAEYDADALCATAPSIMKRIGEQMLGAKVGELRGVTLFCAKTQVSLFADGNICLAILHSDGAIAAEVRDRLGRTAQELARMYAQPA